MTLDKCRSRAAFVHTAQFKMIRFTLLYQLRHGKALSGMFLAPDWDLSVGQCWLISVSQSHRAQVFSRVTIGSKDVL